MFKQEFDIVMIGAGPAGAVASALLNQHGLRVCVLEKQHFPRFVIGESLLPYCMEILAKANMVDAVCAEPSFQFKNGAAFSWGNRYTYFDFTDKFTEGAGTTFQVRRAIFDQILIETAQKQGVEVRFGHGVTQFNNDSDEYAVLSVETDTGEHYDLQAKFVLDASGYGRVLSRLLDLETPSEFPARLAHFTHIVDNISSPQFDRNKILITTHPKHRDVWLWTIPFADNHCSIGVVGSPEKLAGDSETILKSFAYDCPMLAEILRDAVWENEFPFRSIQGYSANVKTLHGKHFALLGNAAEFLDPVFSSGVTIALHSAQLASDLLVQKFQGKSVDWQTQFAEPLMRGVDTFRTYVLGWYDGRFQNAIYAPHRSPEISRMISSILAGYAWDANNPFVAKHAQRLDALAAMVGEVELE